MSVLEPSLVKPGEKRELLNIALYSSGSFISLFGTYIYTFAIGLYVLKLTGSGISFAANLVLGTLPAVIFNPVAGVLADRLDRKTMVVMMDALNGMLLLGLYLLSSPLGLTLFMIYCTTFTMAVFTSVFNVSLDSSIPNIVSQEKLVTINAAGKIIDASSSVLGPMAGGLIYAFADIRYFILINGVSFLISGISGLFLDFNIGCNETKMNKDSIRILQDMKEGLKFLISRRQLVNIMAVFICINFFLSLSVSVPLPFIINNVLKLDSKIFGIIQGTFPVGMILGALFMGKFNDRIKYKKLLTVANPILALCMIAIGLPVLLVHKFTGTLVFPVYFAFTAAVLGIVIAAIDIPITVILQKSIPDECRGRVMSLVISLVKAVSPLALVLSGVLVTSTPAFILPICGGVLFFIINLYFDNGDGSC